MLEEPVEEEEPEEEPTEEGGGIRDRAKSEALNRGKKAAGEAAKKGAQAAGKAAAAGAKAAFLAMGPWGWAALAIIVIGLIVMAIFLMVGLPGCSTPNPQGRSPNQQVDLKTQQNLVNDFLSMAGDPTATAKMVADSGQKLIDSLKTLQTQTTNADVKGKIDALIQVVNQIMTLPRADTDGIKEKVASAKKIWGEIEKIIYPGGAEGLKEYVKLANEHGAKLKMPGPGNFNAWRDPNSETGRRRAGLHNGFDFMASAGSPVIAGWPGEVTKISKSKGSGYFISVRDPSGKFFTIYGHVSPEVKKGDKIVPGQRIATIFNYHTPHLDLKIRSNDGRFINYAAKPWYARLPGKNNNPETQPWT